MISRESLEAYSVALELAEQRAASNAEEMIRWWMTANPEASVAEIREMAIDAISVAALDAEEIGASLAAEWYGAEAMRAGKALDTPLLSVTGDQKQVEKTVHYQAGKLVQGDEAGFMEQLKGFTRDRVRLAANDTIKANCKRDRKKGVRYARVTSGMETCTFCMMLSSRGFTYYSAESAGEQSHYHRGCRCKIVPGFDDANPIEGYDKDECYRLWKEFKKVDDEGWPRPQAEALKVSLLSDSPMTYVNREFCKRETEIYEKAIKDAWNRCIQEQGIDDKRMSEWDADIYEATFNNFIKRFGQTRNIQLSCEYGMFEDGNMHFADPSGKELFAASRCNSIGRGITFRFKRRPYKSADLGIDGKLCEIKTPERYKRISGKIHEGVSQVKEKDGSYGVELIDLNWIKDAPTANSAKQVSRVFERETIPLRMLMYIDDKGRLRILEK